MHETLLSAIVLTSDQRDEGTRKEHAEHAAVLMGSDLKTVDFSQEVELLVSHWPQLLPTVCSMAQHQLHVERTVEKLLLKLQLTHKETLFNVSMQIKTRVLFGSNKCVAGAVAMQASKVDHLRLTSCTYTTPV